VIMKGIDGVDRRAVEQHEVGAAGIDLHVADGVEQIGRASCRERV